MAIIIIWHFQTKHFRRFHVLRWKKLSRVIANSSLGRGLYPLELTQQIAYNSYLVRTFVLGLKMIIDKRKKEREREREREGEICKGSMIDLKILKWMWVRLILRYTGKWLMARKKVECVSWRLRRWTKRNKKQMVIYTNEQQLFSIFVHLKYLGLFGWYNPCLSCKKEKTIIKI